MFEAHRPAVADGEAGGVEEIDFEVEEGFEQVADGVGRVGVVAVEGYDDVAGGFAEAGFVGASVAADVFADDFGTERVGYVAGAVGGAVIDDDDLIDQGRHAAQDALDALFFIQTGNDDGDFQVTIQVAIVAANDRTTTIDSGL